jgi:hypothetical protein
VDRTFSEAMSMPIIVAPNKPVADKISSLFFLQLGFNLSNLLTDTLESSSILIYLSKCMSLYTQNEDRMPLRLNDRFKVCENRAAGVVS